MSESIQASVLAVVAGDQDFYVQLVERGVLPSEQALRPEHVERARVAYTLVHELEVNWPAVEVIIRMREELIQTRLQVAALIELLRATEE